MVLLATHWDGTQNAISLADPKNLEGKVVVDITNPLDFSTGKPELSIGFTTSYQVVFKTGGILLDPEGST
jgi:8-hydroxy-5-deazaflavin:NADPH oxidoreductase